MKITDLIQRVESKQDLTQAESSWLMDQIMDGNLESEIVKQIILGLKAKGEASDEVIGFVDAMMSRTSPINLEEISLDIVGTGGDQLGSVNISSTAAIIAAAAGAIVVKHGNRAASSKSGSADVLEALGINLQLSADQIKECIAQVGIAFCFAPQFHPAMKNVAPIRKEIGVPTIFNILGPLANPAQPKSMLIGVADPDRAKLISEVLAARGVIGMVVNGDDGLDEITVTTTSTLWQFGHGEIIESKLDPADFNMGYYEITDLLGGDANENAQLLMQTLDPKNDSRKITAIRSAVVLNAAGGLLAYWLKQAKIQSPINSLNWQTAIDAAHAAIASGAALDKLTKWQHFSASL